MKQPLRCSHSQCLDSKQRKTTEQRSEKVTATSVRKAAGSQGSWFKKTQKIKKCDWQFSPDHEMPACD